MILTRLICVFAFSRIVSSTTHAVPTTLDDVTTYPYDKDFKTCPTSIDIAYMIDGSDSINKEKFNLQKTVVNVMAYFFGVMKLGSHNGVIVFSDTAKTKVKFTDHYTFDGFRDAVKALQKPSGGTRIDIALEEAHDNLFMGGGGSRTTKQIPKILVIFADTVSGGVSLDTAVQQLRKKGVIVFAVGIGHAHELAALERLAVRKDLVFLAVDFLDLYVKAGFIARRICEHAHATVINSTVSTAIVTDVKLITNPPTTSTTDTTPNTTTDVPKKHKSDSLNVTIIAVCVGIAILILCGILGFIFCRRRRLSGKATSNTVKQKQSDNAAIKPGHVHAEPEVTFRTSSVSDDCGYEIPYIKKTVSPGQAGALTAEPQHKKRWNNRDVEDKEVIDDSDYVIPAVPNTKSSDQAGASTGEPQHGKRWNNRDVEDNVVIDDPGYEIPNRPDVKTTLSPDEADALYAQPEGEKEDDGGYVKPDDMEDGLGYLIPANAENTTLGKDDYSSTLKGDVRDSAENGHYQSLKAEERYEHVYQGLLPTTNR